ncbi:hypothetical protein [Sulfurimonas sp. HSL3-7]|uniref:hypothetical protein n=1 Tax=Sulfonitrofixus jiaomeiensis TaxID=3131938 RepID=UPI0031FA48EC
MNILLVNNDAIVTKLVKLSTQKTGDRLDTATSIDEIREGSYDLLILDGNLFSRDFLERLNDKIIYAHSLIITTRESEDTDLFEKHLYKPFLPTELLLMLHQIGTSVEKEHEEASREIIFDDFEEPFISKDDIFGGEDEAEQDALERVQRFEKIDEEPFEEINADEASEEEVLENIFSDEEVSAVKAILDVLGEERPDEENMAEDTFDTREEAGDIDQELEAALRNLSEADLARGLDDELLLQFDDLPADDLAWEEPKTKSPSKHQNQESIETLRTLLKALENPQLSKSLRGTITINLTFGEDNES